MVVHLDSTGIVCLDPSRGPHTKCPCVSCGKSTIGDVEALRSQDERYICGSCQRKGDARNGHPTV